MIFIEKATPELFTAMAQAQLEVENAAKSSNNPHFKSKYADLAEVLNTVRPVFAKHGLSIIQAPAFDGARASVTTVVAHKSGGLIYSTASAVPAKTDAQGIGAVTTYLRRYGLAAMAGIAQEDDDGQSAAHNKKPEPIPAGRPLDGAWDSFNEEAQAYLREVGAECVRLFNAGQVGAACVKYETGHDSDEKVALWTLFDSKMRAAMKKHKAENKD
jgi:hypothetical protein